MDTADAIRAAAAELSELTAYTLARVADCADPDTPTSAGAAMLGSVADMVAELLTFTADDLADVPTDAEGIEWIDHLNFDGSLSNVADCAPDVYTAQKWREFTDLAAWNEDVTEFGPVEDMDKAASVALYMIAERLATGLVARVAAELYATDSL